MIETIKYKAFYFISKGVGMLIKGSVIKGYGFTEGMIDDANAKKKDGDKGCNPRPSVLEGSKHGVILTIWDFWYNLVPILKEELGRRLPEGSLSRNNDEPLFFLIWEDDKFRLHILKGWAAETLGLPKEYDFQKSQPTDAYNEIVGKFIN